MKTAPPPTSLTSQQHWEEGVQLHLLGAGCSLIHDGGSHPRDVFKPSKVAMGMVTHCSASSRLLKSGSTRGVMCRGLSPGAGDAFGPTHVTGAVAFSWLQKLGWPHQGSWEQMASYLIASSSLPLKLGGRAGPAGPQLSWHPIGVCRQLTGDAGTDSKLEPASKANLFPFLSHQLNAAAAPGRVGCPCETRGQNERARNETHPEQRGGQEVAGETNTFVTVSSCYHLERAGEHRRGCLLPCCRRLG